MIVAKVDVSLTSCIACSFLLNGLVDLNLIRERSWGFMYVHNIVEYTVSTTR